MAINYEVLDFPRLGIQSQLFYAGGAAFDGGFTSGGARVLLAEPGGRAFLELQLSLQVNEWTIPFASWLMSKVNNGTIFRVPLTKTPQLACDATLGIDPDALRGVPWATEGMYASGPWDNSQLWSSDGLVLSPAGEALEGSNTLIVDMTGYGQPLQIGHVIGVEDNAYLIDAIEYDGNMATITTNPPLRQDVSPSSMVLTRPYFLGSVSNGSEFRTTYERANNGHLQPGRLIFTEVIL